MYLNFMHKDVQIVLSPEAIEDIREQLTPQLKKMTFAELVETFEATGLSARNLVTLFEKAKRSKEVSNKVR